MLPLNAGEGRQRYVSRVSLQRSWLQKPVCQHMSHSCCPRPDTLSCDVGTVLQPVPKPVTKETGFPLSCYSGRN